jgi:long-chain acyl-CoA synthetase
MNIPQRFMASVRRWPSRPAVVDGDEVRTYRQLAKGARRLGGLIRRRARSDTVAIILPTCKEFFAVYLGVLFAGKIPVPVNFLLKPEEVRFILEDCRTDTLVTATFFRNLVPEDVVRPMYLDQLGRMDKISALLLPAGVPDTPEEETATLLYTSGTTDKPKGVVLSHGNLVADAVASAEMAKFDRPLNFLGVLPLFHSFALTCTLLIPLLYGGTVVTHKRFQPRRNLESIAGKGIEVLLAVPSMYRLLTKAQQTEPVDISSVKIAIAGGEPLPQDLAQEFEAVFGLPLLEGYGLTESSPVISLNTPDRNRPGTAGRPLHTIETRVVDLDSGAELGPDEEGELQVRGPIVMQGYHKRPEETAETILPGGWLRTGDLAVRDADGFLAIRGRAKELIIVAGENVSPGEIEDVLFDHPDVFEVAVVPEQDPKRGEVPLAHVVLNEGAEAGPRDLLRHCRERLAPFKVPRRIVLHDELPHGPTGKILKRELRQREGEDSG